MPSHRDDERPELFTGEDGSRRARWTLGAAVAGSLLLVGVTAFFVRLGNEPVGEEPPPVSLTEPWEPPLRFESEPARSETPSVPVATTPHEQPVRTRPPAPVTKKPVEAPPALSVTRSSVPAVVDLSGVGTRDWLHWGLSSPESVDRRAGGSGEIKDLVVSAPAGRYDNNPQSFSWTVGTPTASAGPSPTGLYVCQPGATFTIAVAAAPATRTLRLYAGVWMAEGRLTATLAGRTVTAELVNERTNGNAVFVLRFRAPAAETLRVTWANAVPHHPTCGNVNVQAAALS
ncbi:hypothetical protein OWR29_01075 [Actinoplanes sp. Pm04-4]|uniref:Uncharacterized protein n=1 Tax=Paractinoplanes pyxinae TaxID=2997416 RepID=A0ABT4AQQ5_9ACTN|nr:hypothetical protein [Actinoplanes pyxinae]MCY1136571.1 hypothetical protein [Actinoplanes pyxinae]